jgi:hypothetical protein
VKILTDHIFSSLVENPGTNLQPSEIMTLDIMTCILIL